MAGRVIWPIGEPAAERRIATFVTTLFVLAGTAWILFSDLVLYSFTRDETVIAHIETAKGYVFVGLAAWLLYALTRRSVGKLAEASRTVSAVVESIADGVLLLGSDRTIAYANPASIEMLRAGKLRDLQGMNAQEFSRRFRVSYLDGRMVPPDEFVSQRVFEEEGPIRYKAILWPPGGPEVVATCTAAGVRSEVGKTADIVVSVMHDITATEHLERLRDELFTAAAHTMKTPVAVIKSAAQVISVEGSAQVRRSTAMIDRQCAKLQRLIDNLLVLSRIRSGSLQLHPVEVDLGRLVEEVIRENIQVSREHLVDVRLDAHLRVHADRERIEMVLQNVLHAATRSSRPDGPVIVHLKRCGDDAEIAVSFEPTSSGDAVEPSTTDAEYDEIGVGRYVTAAIVETHGGTLAEQTDGGLRTLRILLPAAPEGAV
jgi:two-component system phosphate regulon sensor histidine kinase PhoR